MTSFAVASVVSLALLAAFALALVRAIRGPTLIDRAAALDVATSAAAALVLLLINLSPSGRSFADLPVLLTAGGFISALFLSRLHERGQ